MRSPGRRFAELEERLATEVARRERLDRRVTELTEVVAELLLPLDQRDGERVDQILARYRSGR
jgi:hypothetical protein